MPYPSLFARLIRPDPGDPEGENAFDEMKAYQQDVRRNLKWLLNAVAHPPGSDIGRRELTAKSVINFGAPSLSGTSLHRIEMDKLCKATTSVIKDFEPRLHNVKVRPEKAYGGLVTGKVSLVIEAELRGGEFTRQFTMRTVLDPDHGRWSVDD